MTMITQSVDPHHFIKRARQIKARIPFLLSQWGLLPRFKRWRLAQDPETGMVILFGVLNNKYIALHTTTPFSDYFDPRLLSDLSTDLHVQVISSANDGLRYAFVLESGQLELPENVGALSPAVPVETLEQAAVDQSSPQPNNPAFVEDHTFLHQRLAKFLKNYDDPDNTRPTSMPDVLFMDRAEFNQEMVDFESNRENAIPKKP
jgi:hypothetical protein